MRVFHVNMAILSREGGICISLVGKNPSIWIKLSAFTCKVLKKENAKNVISFFSSKPSETYDFWSSITHEFLDSKQMQILYKYVIDIKTRYNLQVQ